MSFITQKQFEELEDVRIHGSQQEFNELLEKYTDIKAHLFASYIYADCADNYVGDSENFDLRDLLTNAYIEVRSDTNDRT